MCHYHGVVRFGLVRNDTHWNGTPRSAFPVPTVPLLGGWGLYRMQGCCAAGVHHKGAQQLFSPGEKMSPT